MIKIIKSIKSMMFIPQTEMNFRPDSYQHSNNYKIEQLASELGFKFSTYVLEKTIRGPEARFWHL